MATALVISISANMASTFKTGTLEKVTELKEAAENLNTRKSTINWLRDFKKWCDENIFEKNQMILLEHLDKVLERFYASVFKKVDGTNLSPMILKGNLKAREIITILTKTRVKLLPNFTRHPLITHNN